MEQKTLMGNNTPSLGRFKPRLDGIIAIKGIIALISKEGGPCYWCFREQHGDETIPGWAHGNKALQQGWACPVYFGFVTPWSEALTPLCLPLLPALFQAQMDKPGLVNCI